MQAERLPGNPGEVRHCSREKIEEIVEMYHEEENYIRDADGTIRRVS